MILGPVPDARFRRGYAHLDPGDTLVMVTDGVLERLGPGDEEFGDDGLEKIVAPLVGKPADEVMEVLLTAACEHGQGRPWADDTTAVVMTRQAGSRD